MNLVFLNFSKSEKILRHLQKSDWCRNEISILYTLINCHFFFPVRQKIDELKAAPLSEQNLSFESMIHL